MTDESGSHRFLDIPKGFHEYANSRVVIWPVPYERTTSWGHGTAGGPRAILDASGYLEYYDDELDWEPYRVGIHTLPEIDLSDLTDLEALERLGTHAARYCLDDKFVLTLGGEHTLSIPIIRALKDKYSDLSVLQIDAHADLRNSYEGTTHSHACVMRRVVEICPLVQVGIRSMSKEEKNAAAELPTRIFLARNIVGRTDWIAEAVGGLSEHVYLTIDVDGLDPSLVPATGTPEPGGMSWSETLELIRQIAESRTIVGADIVELSPIDGLHSANFLCAKLAYKIIGYALRGS